jgi:hypothetical protein
MEGEALFSAVYRLEDVEVQCGDCGVGGRVQSGSCGVDMKIIYI